MTDWHRKTARDTAELLDSNLAEGLKQAQAADRLLRHGPNELIETGGRGPWRILVEQISGAMVLMLIGAAIISAFLHEYTDSIVILAIVFLNAILGFAQDYRAEKAMTALKQLALPTVRVRRDGMVHEVSAREIVPGEIVLIEVGNYVPADCRLIEAVNLRIQESALTGESGSIDKQTEILQSDDDLPIGDRNNSAFMGTVVTHGHGQAIVTETGMDTELGRIASSLQNVESEPTPLQKRLAQLGRTLALVAVGIVTVVFGLGILRGEDPALMLMTALSLAVAVVPEGLPAVATVALALGARRMFHQHALIRKLPAVETLGSVTVICSDKTGTLTQNKMAVTVLDVAGRRLDIGGTIHGSDVNARDSDGETATGRVRCQVAENSTLAMLLAGAALCNDASLESMSTENEFQSIGEPTESALVIAAAHLGLRKDRLESCFPRESELPFDSDRKCMTTIHRVKSAETNNVDCPAMTALNPIAELDGDYIAFTKGAVDGLVEHCEYYWDDDEPKAMDQTVVQRIAAAHENLASDGMRVLGVALRPLDGQPSGGWPEPVEQQLIFLGMLGIIDPPRAEVADAVAQCRSAGIRPIMITGDHPLTAQHIARQLNIAGNGVAMTGQDLDQIDDEDLAETIRRTSVYARVAPKHKLKLVQTLQDQGQVVAMTGDGVNDAPALKQAHIGVAMGITGTDVSKEASQMILLDDNFATIVGAVKQGRIVYDNIRKFVKYTMTSNAGEIWVMVLGPLLGMPLPLLPLQILWINLVTDGLPGLALAMEKAESDTMRRPPYPASQPIFDAKMIRDIAWIGLLMGIVSLVMGYWSWNTSESNDYHWRTIIFTVLTLTQMGNALAIRSSKDSLFRIGIFSNMALVGSVGLTFALQVAVIYWAPLQNIFKTSPLSAWELVLCIVISTIVFWAIEAQKWFLRFSNAD
ncbi:MAG: cation-translocating P-type ATPase [Planctomycetales bacterium]|nr:cation-translocating P-type ATPase [Planctomycetales bacterium]